MYSELGYDNGGTAVLVYFLVWALMIFFASMIWVIKDKIRGVPNSIILDRIVNVVFCNFVSCFVSFWIVLLILGLIIPAGEAIGLYHSYEFFLLIGDHGVPIITMAVINVSAFWILFGEHMGIDTKVIFYDSGARLYVDQNGYQMDYVYED